MKVFFRILVCLCLWLNVYSAIGQGYEVSGRVIDANSEEVIPFANIALKDIYKGTASNAVGEFSFKVDSLPVVLVISHLSYEPFEVEVYDEEPVDIKLTPGKLLMDELVIRARGNNSYAYNLVSKAYYKIYGRSNKSHYGKAFYRQISKNGDEYSELYEMFFDTRYSLNGVEEWAIQEGRYALKLSSADSFIYNKNFTLMVRLLTIVQPKTEDLIMPVSNFLAEQYDLRLIQLLSVDNRKVAQIRFTKKDHIRMPAMEGDLFIDVDSYHILKITGEIANDNLNFITLKGEKGSWKNYVVSWEIAFKPLEEDLIALDYVRLGQHFDYYYDDVFANKVETSALLTYYEYYVPPSRKKLGGRLLKYNKRDSDVLDNIGYNQQFWDENIIVKRTPIESDVTASFEAERAFGSIYLNNKNQIILEDYELDKDSFIMLAKKKLSTFELPRNGYKVYLHHDKPYYVSGEKVWFKSYLVNMATNIPSDDDGVVAVDLLTPEGRLVVTELFSIRDGVAFGQLNLPDDLGSGQYTLRAYTDRMRNHGDEFYYREVLDIYNGNDVGGTFKKIKRDSVSRLTFYPEGGQVVASIPVQLGFVARDEFGEALDIRGKVFGENGRVINTLKTDFEGTGSIFMLPVANQQYKTSVISHEIQEIQFPEVLEMGYSVMVNNLRENSIDLTVRGTMKLEGKKFYLLVISNGILYDRRLGSLTRGTYKAEFPKSNLPTGISQILLVDESGKIRCKRFVFINQPEEVLVNYYFAKKEFRPRDRIDMVLELNDQNGKSINGANISISVIDKDRIERNRNGRSIKSYLLLDHILDYQLNNQEELFSTYDRETLKDLDFLMLLQQTSIPEIKSFDSLELTDQKQAIQYDNWQISGKAFEEDSRKPLDNGTITFFQYPNMSTGILRVKCDEDGNFNLGDIYLEDSARVLVKANDREGRLKKIFIDFDHYEMVQPDDTAEVALVEVSANVQPYIDYANSVLTNAKAVQYRKLPLVGFPGLYKRADYVINIDEKLSRQDDLLELFSDRAPGINLSQQNRETSLRVRGEDGTPLILLDGVSVNEYMLGFDDVDYSHLDSIPESAILTFLSEVKTRDIQRIDVVKPTAAITKTFGMRAAHGLIAVYSKEGMLMRDQANDKLTTVWIPGLSAPDVFTTSNYSAGFENDAAPRRRATIYWNPDVQTNRKGRAKISFYNSDDARTLQICVEGISDEGVPIFSIFEIGRNSEKDKVN